MRLLSLSFVVLIGVWLLVSTSVDQLSHNADDYRLQIVQTWDSISAWLRDFFRLENDAEGGIGGDQLKQQIGTTMLRLGSLQEARPFIEEGIELFRELEAQGLVDWLLVHLVMLEIGGFPVRQVRQIAPDGEVFLQS